MADVAVFSLALWEQTADDDYFHGAPAIVVEVLSPSNSASDLLEREDICVRRGGREFWIIDPHRQTLKVVGAEGNSTRYHAIDVIDSAMFREPMFFGNP